MLLNIDKPLRSSTLHDEACSYVPKPHGTRFKPLGTLGRDGGWFSVSSVSHARMCCRSLEVDQCFSFSIDQVIGIRTKCLVCIR